MAKTMQNFLAAVGSYAFAWLVVLALGPAPTLAAAPAATPAARVRVVLPDDVTPEHYRIEITPDAAALRFSGTVQIEVTVHRATSRVVLNSADITIDQASVSANAQVTDTDYDPQVQTATLRLDRELAPGSYTLSLNYHGKIYQQASGFFALDYQSPEGKSRALFTQFENSDARRFVPCWDEPGRKATFELTATVPTNEMAISNMPIASTEEAGPLKKVHFATTPKMSSYLLFFGLGDFERVHRDVGGVDVGVVVKRGDTVRGAFALDAAVHLLPYYNEYFGTPYPLPKLDLIAAPGESAFFGAMENWGAILYFERDLLVDSRISTEHDKQRVYIVVAHEMAHQWFGDLVTMAWWDDLWLNEGFASWMENRATEHFHPEWKVWLQTLRPIQFAMELDERDGTHPIITPIYDAEQASGAFDNITYTKGASVIRMLESYAGEARFRAGVQRYMRDHAYGNTVSDDLWKEIDRRSKQPIAAIAHGFSLQSGVPMINEVSTSCAAGRTTVEFTQTHFAIDPESTSARDWQVPVTAAILGSPAATHIIAGASPQKITQAGCGPLIVNLGQTAYFRTHYSAENLKALSTRYSALRPDDQMGVLNDTRALAYTGEEPMAALLDLIGHFPADADPIVSSTLARLLLSLDRLYDELPTQAAFRAYATKVLAPMFDRVGWDQHTGERDNVALLRADLIGALSAFGNEAVIVEARKRFDQFARDPSSTTAEARRTILGVVALHADEPTWERLHSMAKSATSELERAELYELLGQSERRELVTKALDLALSGEPPATIAPEIVSSASGRHPEMAFDFATTHWGTLSPFIEPTSRSRYVPLLVTNAFDPRLIGQLDAFATKHIPDGSRQDLRKAESNIRYRAEVRTKRLPEVAEWLQRRAS